MAEHALDIALEHGSPDLPACVLIHGVGMNKHFWSAPEEARVMGSLLPLTAMLSGYDEMRTLYHDLSVEGFTVLTWSQARPVGPTREGADELRRTMDILWRIPHSGLILIGHSRGGLIARAALAQSGFLPDGEKLLGLITLSTPHAGSELSRWALHAGRLTSLLNERIKDPDERRSVLGTLKNMLGFVESKGVKELLPGSDLLASLPACAPLDTYSLSIGGTDPALLSLPGIFSFPSSLEAVFPSRLFPDEMTEGKGDGLVAARSARLPGALEHLDFHVNHAAVVVDPQVRKAVLHRIKIHCLP